MNVSAYGHLFHHEKLEVMFIISSSSWQSKVVEVVVESYKQNLKIFFYRSKVMTYIGEDAIALLTNAALETEGQVVAADHDTTAKALLKWLHVWLDA